MKTPGEINRYVDQLIPYSALPDRPPLEWPGKAKLALLIIPNVEIYEYLPPFNPVKNPYPRFGSHPDIGWYSHREYGNRVGFWRMLELFDRFQLPVTVSLSLRILDLLPEIRDAMLERDWEIMSHGLDNTQYLYGVPEEEERIYHEQTQEIALRHLGRRLKGFLAPAFTSTVKTPELLAAAGYEYCMDWFIDDQPFPMRTPCGPLVGVPYAKDINDAFAFGGHPYFAYDAETFFQMARDQFDCLYEEGGRVMTVALHPYLSSQPYRQRHLERMLEYMLSRPGVWATQAWHVAEHFRKHYFDEWDGRSVDLKGEGYDL